MSETKNEFSDYLFANNIACGVTESDGAKVIGMLLDMLKRHFPHMIWLNPVPLPDYGSPQTESHLAIAELVDMFDLTLDGLEKGFRFLLSGKK